MHLYTTKFILIYEKKKEKNNTETVNIIIMSIWVKKGHQEIYICNITRVKSFNPLLRKNF